MKQQRTKTPEIIISPMRMESPDLPSSTNDYAFEPKPPVAKKQDKMASVPDHTITIESTEPVFRPRRTKTPVDDHNLTASNLKQLEHAAPNNLTVYFNPLI